MPTVIHGGEVSNHRISPAKRRSLGCVPFLVSVTQVESDELPIAVREVTFVYLFWVMIQLMAVAVTTVSRNSERIRFTKGKRVFANRCSALE